MNRKADRARRWSIAEGAVSPLARVFVCLALPLLVSCLLPPALEAAAPVVDRFEAIPATPSPGELATVVVEAHDPDCAGTCTSGCGQRIRADLVEWSATGGTFEAIDNGASASPYTATAQWRAPTEEGTYTLTVTLPDSGSFLCGGRQSSTAELPIQVTTLVGSAPEITRIEASPLRLLPEQEARLTCSAEDADGDAVTYSWSTDLGTVTDLGATALGTTAGGSGSAAFRSDRPGIATVTCLATDSVGAFDAGTVRLAVVGALPERTVGRDLVSPHRLAVDSFGILYVADRGAGGVAAFHLGSGELIYRLMVPDVVSVAVDWNDHLVLGRTGAAHVVDWGGNVVLDLDGGPPSGEIADLAVDPEARRYAVLYRRAGRVVVHDDAGRVVTAFGGNCDAPEQLKSPGGLAVTPAGEWVVADGGHGQIKVFGPDGTLRSVFGGPGGGVGELVQLDDVAVGADGTVFASDSFQDWIQSFEADGTPREVLGTYGEGPGELKTPTGLLVADGFGRLVVASTNSSRLEIYRLDVSPPQPPQPALEVSPDQLDFARRPVGRTTGARHLTLTNAGAAPLGLRGLVTEGDFLYATDCPDFLLPGASCRVSVSFVPATAGLRQGALRLDTSAGPRTVVLTGIGLAPPGQGRATPSDDPPEARR